MSVSVTHEGSICVLRVNGDFVGDSASQFRELAARTIADDGRDFVIDLSEAATINSEGLEALTWLRRESEDQLGMVKLCHVPDTIKQILFITRLSTQFEQVDLIEHALTSFS